ncbi:hypothetical protein ACB098_12G011000 [Castanea mollissima]
MPHPNPKPHGLYDHLQLKTPLQIQITIWVGFKSLDPWNPKTLPHIKAISITYISCTYYSFFKTSPYLQSFPFNHLCHFLLYVRTCLLTLETKDVFVKINRIQLS